MSLSLARQYKLNIIITISTITGVHTVSNDSVATLYSSRVAQSCFNKESHQWSGRNAAGLVALRMDSLQDRQEPSTSYAAPAYEPALPVHQQMRQLTEDEIAQGCKLDPCIGMRVKRLWPEVCLTTAHGMQAARHRQAALASLATQAKHGEGCEAAL